MCLGQPHDRLVFHFDRNFGPASSVRFGMFLAGSLASKAKRGVCAMLAIAWDGKPISSNGAARIWRGSTTDPLHHQTSHTWCAMLPRYL